MLKNAELANAIRVLSMDAVQSANSGHPGMPMGMADIAEVLWRKTLKHNPTNQHWFNRDRFVVSNGHGSMLLYSLLHLTGYEVSVDDLKAFRQLHSKTPGHPEFGITPGVETTTGPLGQGIANAVGMALAEKLLAHEFNKPDLEIVDHNTFVFMGDGCLMEGLSHEVCSLAGTLKLGKLIVFYDDNGISIDSEKGNIKSWFSEDVPARFESYGWRVIRDVDGHDRAAIEKAINLAMEKGDSPTLVCCKTRIGRGAPNKENTGSAHGAPLGPDEIAAAREAMGWEHPPFEIPQKIYEQWDAKERGKSLEAEWAERFSAYERKYPALAGEFKRRMAGNLPEDW
ncbi:MAG: transketolase, partial [Betaproteobacteria bacterium]